MLYSANTNNTSGQSFSNISSTFDIILPEEKGNDSITPLSSIVGEKSPAVAFTLDLFKSRPELFGVYALSLIYAQYSGTAYKPDIIYSSFELFLRQNTKAQLIATRTRELRPYEFDVDLLITWARIMQRHKTNIIFEPVMNKLSRELNNWLQNRIFTYGGVEYNIDILRPFCYTASGENIITLLPYLCYVMTFLIHCRPYTFNEAQTESSTYGFYKALQDYYQKNYTALGQDFKIDVLKSNIQELKVVPDKYFQDMFKVMLHPDKIIGIRDAEMKKTPGLLEECIADQNELGDITIREAWQNTMSQIVRRIISLSPIKKIFDKIPRFNSNSLDVTELMMLTQYCLAGGDKPFCLETPGYHYRAQCDDKSLKQLPPNVFGRQSIFSQISVLNSSIKTPFCENDVILQLCMGYLRDEFDTKRSDILNDNPIKIDEGAIRNDNLWKELRGLFLNGLWALENNSIYDALVILEKIPRFQQEMNDVLSLYSATLTFFDNRIASIILPTLLISYLDTFILDTCVNGYDIGRLSMYGYFSNDDFQKHLGDRIAKLLDMTVSLMYIHSVDYERFVNSTVRDFEEMMNSKSIIQQVYVKGLKDGADLYAIGGCDTYNYAKYINPLVRAYGWYVNVYGNTERLYVYNKWMMMLNNNSLMELLEGSMSTGEGVEGSLYLQFMKLINAKKEPNVLENYIFENGGYKRKNHPYVNVWTMKGEKSITDVLRKYAFPRSNARNVIEPKVVFKQILYRNGKVNVGKSIENGMVAGNMNTPARISEGGNAYKVPVYNFEGRIESMKLMFTPVSGMRMVPINTFNSRRKHNQTMLLFTDRPMKSRFQKYDFQKKNRIPMYGRPGDEHNNVLILSA